MYIHSDKIFLETEVSWDPNKERSNLRKHGVSFFEALTVLWNPSTLSNQNTHPTGTRYEYLGFSAELRMLYVVTCEETEDQIRILSARKATKKEEILYEQNV